MPVRNEQALYSLKIGNVFKSRKRLLQNFIPGWLASYWGRQEYVTHWWIGVTHNLCFDGFTFSFHKSNYNSSYEILAKSTQDSKPSLAQYNRYAESLYCDVIWNCQFSTLTPFLPCAPGYPTAPGLPCSVNTSECKTWVQLKRRKFYLPNLIPSINTRKDRRLNQLSPTHLIWVDPWIRFVWLTWEFRLWSNFVSYVKLFMCPSNAWITIS